MEDQKSTKAKYRNVKKHPRDRANILSHLFFCWELPIFIKGLKKSSAEKCLYRPLKAHKAKLLGNKLEDLWNEEVQSQERPSLWRVLRKAFGPKFALYGLLFMPWEFFIRYLTPWSLNEILKYYEQSTIVEKSKDQAWFYTSIFVAVAFVNSIIQHATTFSLQHFGMKCRIACCSLIYRKSLQLGQEGAAHTSGGQIINLLSKDAGRFDLTIVHLHYLWIAPLQIILSICWLYIILGLEAIVGIVVFMVLLIIQVVTVKKLASKRRCVTVASGERIQLMNEIISGIQLIKMYRWEEAFSQLIQTVRKTEMKYLNISALIQSFNFSICLLIIRLVLFFSILTFVLCGVPLDAQHVYVLTALLSIVNVTLTQITPYAIQFYGDLKVSVDRIEKFLISCEHKKMSSYKSTISSDCKLPQVILKNGTVKNSRSKALALDSVNFHASPRKLVAIVGAVGSGKSTLLQVILGEVSLYSGVLEKHGSISYCPQQAWVFSSTIRQNILFGEEMEEARYRKVVEICCLDRDFLLLPQGDQSIVGDRGVTLSGGQRARINLARSVYRNADIYLLDDPLAAVDARVGNQLFHQGILGFLKDKCTILITNQLQFLQFVDEIFVLDKGKLIGQGTYQEVTRANLVQFIEKDAGIDNADQTEDLLKVKDEDSNSCEEEEKYSTSNRSWPIYKQYFCALKNSCCNISILLIISVVTQFMFTIYDYFLNFWVNFEQTRQNELSKTAYDVETPQDDSGLFEFFSSKKEFFTTTNFLYTLSILSFLIVVLNLLCCFATVHFALRISKKLHNSMFSAILYAPMQFFHKNPSGRILNRFSTDVNCIDETLPMSLVHTISIIFQLVGAIIIIITMNYWIALPSAFMLVILNCYRVVFLRTSRHLKRIESIRRSPIYSHVNASHQGLSTIKAFGAREILIAEFDEHQDRHSVAFYLYSACSLSYSFWANITCATYNGIVAVSFLIRQHQTYSGNVGLALYQVTVFSAVIQHILKKWSSMDNDMTAVERIIEYTKVTGEVDDTSVGTKELLPSWPSDGKIEFKSVSMRYSQDSCLVLRQITLTIQPGEKIGIVGRTGSGKSSLISTLFRLMNFEGTILIDGVNIEEIPLDSLRSKISIIPQEPVLFSGTIRMNLDPFNCYDDTHLWSILDEVHLKRCVSDLPEGLETVLTKGGSLSVGQKQLLCLARVLLRDNRILVLDEATANIDLQTDAIIQETIKRKSDKCTVLTVAHRINTIMNSDRILVMDDGRVVEFDLPDKLLRKPEGIFRRLAQESGELLKTS